MIEGAAVVAKILDFRTDAISIRRSSLGGTSVLALLRENGGVAPIWAIRGIVIEPLQPPQRRHFNEFVPGEPTLALV